MSVDHEADLPRPPDRVRLGSPGREQRRRVEQIGCPFSYTDAVISHHLDRDRFGHQPLPRVHVLQRAPRRDLGLPHAVQLQARERRRRPAGNACFWFEVRSGGSADRHPRQLCRGCRVQHRDDPDDVLDRDPRGDRPTRLNGLVVRVYPRESGTKTKVVNVDLATVTGATPYIASFTAYENQSVDDTSGTPTTPPWYPRPSTRPRTRIPPPGRVRRRTRRGT